MANWIYIAGVFEHLDNEKGQLLDNDPHIWTEPFTWGICRPDLRANAYKGNYIFFVLPKKSPHPQMIFAYIKIEEIITHHKAHQRTDLKSKRMRPGANPNGNILVSGNGCYNTLDDYAHFDRFQKIKQSYAVGCMTESQRISVAKIKNRAEYFLDFLNSLFNYHGNSRRNNVSKIISRKGRKLNDAQVKKLIQWLN